MGEGVKAKNGNRLTCAYARPREWGSRFSISGLHLGYFIRVGGRCPSFEDEGARDAATVWAASRILSGESTEQSPDNVAKPKDFVDRSHTPQEGKTRKKVGRVKYLEIKPVE